MSLFRDTNFKYILFLFSLVLILFVCLKVWMLVDGNGNKRDHVGGCLECVPRETTGIVRYLCNQLENKYNGNSLDSMRVTLDNTSSNGDTEPKMVMCCNHARLPVEGLGYSPSLKTFYTQFILPTKCSGVKMAPKL